MKKIILSILFVLFITFLVNAQYELDAMRYAVNNPQGTARSQSMGGAMGALGSDFTAVWYNPASMAQYRRSEVSITLQNSSSVINSEYLNNSTEDTRNSFNPSSFGFIGSNQTGNNKWISWQLGGVYNRIDNFQLNTDIRGRGTSSITDYFADRASSYNVSPNNLFDADPYFTGLAYDRYLIDPDIADDTYYNSAIYKGLVQQRNTIEQRGGQNSISLAGSGNYMDLLYVGASININTIKNNMIIKHEEIPTSDSLFLNELRFTQNIENRASSIGATVGIILLPKPWLRVGISYKTPHKYRIVEDFETSIYSVTNDNAGTAYSPKEDSFIYNITIPSRVHTSLGLIIAKRAAFSVDYDFVDISKTKIKAKTDNFSEENRKINLLYRKQHSIRFGLEVRLNKSFSGRMGFATQNNPYKKSETIIETNKNVYSLGFGYKSKNGFFIDIAYSLHKWDEDYYIYNANYVDPSTLNYRQENYTLSTGYRF